MACSSPTKFFLVRFKLSDYEIAAHSGSDLEATAESEQEQKE